ncbi:MAG: chorismate mutase [Lachnospiraceae bacterium]|nr:chorismate mutase [Lachnospiraceae bacterium]
MSNLEEARDAIDKIDREMASLFEKRMKSVSKIADYKQEHGMPVLDKAREAVVFEKNSSLIKDELIASYYIKFLKNTLSLSKQYQSARMKGVRVAFCGIEGAFAEIAAKRIFPEGLLMSCHDFKSAYEAVESGDCDLCVLPIENSYAGEVGQVIDLMFSGNLYVNGVYELPIKQSLIGVPGTKPGDIKKVISHPQALSQCGEYILRHGYETEAASNTAIAAKTVADIGDKTIAAIASSDTAALYELEIIDHDINESATNCTRFAVFSRAEKTEVDNENKFIMLFTVNDTVGALAKIVNIICAHGFNMRVLRSRPVKDVPWQYYFYVEAEGNHTSEEGVRMMNELSVCCAKLKVAGHYSQSISLGK